jgi:hypothetical protein
MGSEKQSLEDETRAVAAEAPSGGAVGHHTVTPNRTVKRRRSRSTGVKEDVVDNIGVRQEACSGAEPRWRLSRTPRLGFAAVSCSEAERRGAGGDLVEVQDQPTKCMAVWRWRRMRLTASGGGASRTEGHDRLRERRLG